MHRDDTYGLVQSLNGCAWAATGYEVLCAQEVPGGVLVSFDDGTSALYSSSLLREALPNAQSLTHRDSLGH